MSLNGLKDEGKACFHADVWAHSGQIHKNNVRGRDPAPTGIPFGPSVGPWLQCLVSRVTAHVVFDTHVVREDDMRLAVQLDGILHPNAPKKENGSGVEPPEPLYLN